MERAVAVDDKDVVIAVLVGVVGDSLAVRRPNSTKTLCCWITNPTIGDIDLSGPVHIDDEEILIDVPDGTSVEQHH